MFQLTELLNYWYENHQSIIPDKLGSNDVLVFEMWMVNEWTNCAIQINGNWGSWPL